MLISVKSVYSSASVDGRDTHIGININNFGKIFAAIADQRTEFPINNK
jgi:hypothetical protein